MSGQLDLSSNWSRQALTTAERRAITERIPDGYTVVAYGLGNPRRYGTYIRDDSGAWVVPQHPARWMKPDIRDAIDAAIDWIGEYDTASYAGVEVPVR